MKSFLDNNGLAYFWTYLKTFFVPQTRTINNKPLSSNIILTVRDLNAIEDPQIKTDGQILCYDGENHAWKAINFEPGGVQSIEEGTVNGTIKVNGATNVFVHGLKSAAYKESSEFKSADWSPTPADIGAIADPVGKLNGQILAYNSSQRAWIAVDKELPTVAADGDILKYVIFEGNGQWVPLPEQTISESQIDGNITAGDTEVPVHGLKSAAFTESNSYVSASSVGSNNGVCPLNSSGIIDPSYIPGTYDNVEECYIVGGVPLASNWLSKTPGGSPLTPQQDTIYIILTEGEFLNTQYRWSGTTYVKLAGGDVSSMTNEEIDEILNS